MSPVVSAFVAAIAAPAALAAGVLLLRMIPAAFRRRSLRRS